MGISVKVIAASVATGERPFVHFAQGEPQTRDPKSTMPKGRANTYPTGILRHASASSSHSSSGSARRPKLHPIITSPASSTKSQPSHTTSSSKYARTRGGTSVESGSVQSCNTRANERRAKPVAEEEVSGGTAETPNPRSQNQKPATATAFSISSHPPSPRSRDPSSASIAAEVNKTAGSGYRRRSSSASAPHPPRLAPVDSPHAPGTAPGAAQTAATTTITTSATSRLRTSPERTRRDSVLVRVPEDGSMNFEPGAGNASGPSALPRPFTGFNNDDSDEETESLLEEELETEGLYVGSYKSLILSYTLVPIVFTSFLILLAFLPTIAYPIINTPPSYPYSSLLPYPLPELLTAICAWSLSHHLREPLYSLTLFLTNPFNSLNNDQIPVPSPLTHLLSTTLHTFFSLLLRQATIIVLGIAHYMVFGHPTWHDWAFRRVWWIGLGWSFAESLVAIKQGYEGIALYKDVLVPSPLSRFKGTGNGPMNGAWGEYTPLSRQRSYGATETSGQVGSTKSRQISPPAGGLGTTDPERPVYDSPVDLLGPDRESALPRSNSKGKMGNGKAIIGPASSYHSEEELEIEVDRNLEQLNALKAREELEEVYGIPFIRIPIFISCLQRINSLLLSLGFFLLLSSAYIRSTFSHPPLPSPLPSSLDSVISSESHSISSHLPSLLHERSHVKSNTYLLATLPILFVAHLTLEILHTPMVLPRIGVHTAVYIALLVSLGSFFAGLAMWEALS
ncbi:hypothetical protein AX16_001570 [Volvariella volvacea WC 439]|nr:hypothetical protein AX16_001570 [Volvariella volvacea WC 439]